MSTHNDTKNHSDSVEADYPTRTFNALLDEATLGIILLDSQLRVLRVNRAAAATLGDIGGDLPGADFETVSRGVWESGFIEQVAAICRHTISTGRPFAAQEISGVRLDCEVTAHYEWQVSRIELAPNDFGAACYFRDISSEVFDRASLAISQEERQRAAKGLRAIASRARCLLWYAEVEDHGGPNLHWVVRMADEEAARRFLPVKVPPGHTYGMALAEARIPDDRERMSWGDTETRAGRSYRQEFRVRDAEGNIRWMSEDVQVESIGPRMWNAVGICIDITERKRSEEERERHQAEIESLNMRLQRAMAETHHRVKNNLQVVSALVDIQSMIHGSQVPAEELLRIGQHVRTLAAIHDLLTQNSKTTGASESILTTDIFQQLAPLLRSVVGTRAIRFEVDELALAHKQGTSLAVLVNELVSNAVKHGSGDIEVSLRVADDRASLAVRDDGPGFAPDFDPVRARNTGLELIESVGRYDLLGSISYENRPEGGACVTVSFPNPLGIGK